MTTLIDYSVTCYSGVERLQSEVSAAFDLIAPKGNWKLSILATLPRDADLDLITDACVHFTGSVPTFTMKRDGWLCTAAGYYATIGS